MSRHSLGLGAMSCYWIGCCQLFQSGQFISHKAVVYYANW